MYSEQEHTKGIKQGYTSQKGRLLVSTFRFVGSDCLSRFGVCKDLQNLLAEQPGCTMNCPLTSFLTALLSGAPFLFDSREDGCIIAACHTGQRQTRRGLINGQSTYRILRCTKQLSGLADGEVWGRSSRNK